MAETPPATSVRCLRPQASRRPSASSTPACRRIRPPADTPRPASASPRQVAEPPRGISAFASPGIVARRVTIHPGFRTSRYCSRQNQYGRVASVGNCGCQDQIFNEIHGTFGAAAPPYADHTAQSGIGDLARAYTRNGERPALVCSAGTRDPNHTRQLGIDREVRPPPSFARVGEGEGWNRRAGLPYNPAPWISAITPGSRLGAYEVSSLLGAGGMGEVRHRYGPEAPGRTQSPSSGRR